MKRCEFILAAVLLAMAFAALASSSAMAAEQDDRISVMVECRCPDPVGHNLCSAVKEKVSASSGYRLADNLNGYGLGIHLACVDMWQGINEQLSGHMSAVSVAFTLYSNRLPGEVFEDTSVSRVGKDAITEMAARIVGAVDQLVKVNSNFFDAMRASVKEAPPSSGSPLLPAEPLPLSSAPSTEPPPAAPAASPSP